MFNYLKDYPIGGHPLTLCNVNPQGNTAAIIAAVLSQLFAPNILEGEYAWNIHQAELESGGMLANLVNWNADLAGAIYTYGGSGCWTYHLKYALTRVLPNSRKHGVRTDAKVICSQQAHYTMLNSSDWTGLGMDNILIIPTDSATNAMDLKKLELALIECTVHHIPIASVVCTMATTDANAFDEVKGVRDLLDQYPNEKAFGKALLYCDAVIGWPWLMFKNYNFKQNPLQFSAAVLPLIEKNYEAIKGIFYADAFGVDFHKTGFSPYISSVFVYKNATEFETLLGRTTPAYLQRRTPYNPMDYTLEVSRAATGSLAGWATLNYFGEEGFQSILGGILENKLVLKNMLECNESMCCVNELDFGLVTLFRIYPVGVHAKLQYNKEFNYPAYRKTLIKSNLFIKAVADLLYDWFHTTKRINGKCTPNISYSAGFCPTTYNPFSADKEALVYALKIFPLNVHVTVDSMQHALNCILAARDEVALTWVIDANGNMYE